jgi:hypothetical protein
MIDGSMIIDGIVIALLAATIFYAFRLERKLEALRGAQTAFADTIRELNGAALRAEAGIQGMKAAAASSGQALDDRIKRARGVSDELAMLVQAGQRMAQRTEAVRAAPQPAPRQPSPSRAASDALRAIGAMR